MKTGNQNTKGLDARLKTSGMTNIKSLDSASTDCVTIPDLSLRATKGSVAISLLSMRYEIASVVSLPRNDIVTQSASTE